MRVLKVLLKFIHQPARKGAAFSRPDPHCEMRLSGFRLVGKPPWVLWRSRDLRGLRFSD